MKPFLGIHFKLLSCTELFITPFIAGKARFSALSSQQTLFGKIVILGCAFPPIIFSIFLVALTTIFSIVNFLLQPFYSFDFIAHELASGTLQLRITSILLGWQIAYTTLRISYSSSGGRKKFLFVNFDANLLSKYPDIDALEPLQEGSGFILLPQFFQFAFYTCVIITLWLILIFQASSLWSQLSNFLVFFILDDWAIVSDYENALKGRIISGHAWKIFVFNLLLLTLCTLAFVLTGTYKYGAVFLVIASILLVFRYVIRYLNDLKNRFS